VDWSTYIAVHMRKVGVRLVSVVNGYALASLPRDRYLVPFVQEAGWDLVLVWMSVEKRKVLPHRGSVPEPFNPWEVYTDYPILGSFQ
jgi:hypothetical protein